MHSVISQGRVEEIVNSKPRDRRLLVEEAAGLGKHRKRRRRAQLKLERTQDEPRPGARRGARGTQPAAPAEAPGAGRRHPRPARARGRPSFARGCSPTSFAPRRASSSGAERQPPRRAKRAGGSRPSSPRSTAGATEIEERLAERDRERTTVWGRADRSASRPRAAQRALRGARRAGAPSWRPRSSGRRAALGALADDAAPTERRRRDPGPGRARADRRRRWATRPRPSSAPGPRPATAIARPSVGADPRGVGARGRRAGRDRGAAGQAPAGLARGPHRGR